MTCPAEQWRPVADPLYSFAYDVSNLGNVRSVRNNIVLQAGKQSKGYLTVVLQVATKTKSMTVHRLVAEAWLESPTEGRSQINHRNGIKTDNRAENLEWCTSAENNRHALATGLRTNRRKAT